MPVTLPDLPYAAGALAPHISKKTLLLHHGKHHKAYVDKINELIAGTRLSDQPLSEIVRATFGDSSQIELFHNAAQAWNHSFFWKCMAPKGGCPPSGEIARLLSSRYGSLEAFKSAFSEVAQKHFGSGWVWLVIADGTLDVKTTPNADTPLGSSEKPLLTCDLWEHSYYVDYENRRPEYVETFLDKLVNWDFASEQLASGDPIS